MNRILTILARRSPLACVLALALCVAATAHAQFSSSVQGNLTDASGAAIPGAQLTLTNTANNVAQDAQTDGTGVFRFSSLAPGQYVVAAKISGFAQARVSFTLEAGENRNVPLTLVVGDVATSVEVTSEAALLDTSDSRRQYTLTEKALNDLPLSSRNPTALLGVTPGVTGGLDIQQNLNNAPENFIDTSANGRGQNGNTYVVDGLDVTSNVRPGVVTLTPGADSIQEVSVQTNTYSVEYGRGGGAQTLLTTKSGSNTFHGFASEYYTYQGFAARGEFGAPKALVPNTPPYHSNNAAFGLGGPIWRSHQLFFFATYQPYSYGGSSFGQITYEDPAFVAFAQSVRPNSPELQLFTKYPIGSTTGSTVSATASQQFGAANCGTAAYNNIPCNLPVIDTAQFNFAAANKAKQYSARIDKYFSKDRVYVDFIRNTLTTQAPNPRPAFSTSSTFYGLALQGNETHTFNPTLLNEVAFAFNRIEGISPQTGLFTVPVVNVGGLGRGFGSGFAQGDFYQHSYHWRDVVTKVHGAHSFKFGYEGWHGDDTAIFQGPYGQPNFYYNNLIDLINDKPYSESSLSYNPLSGQPQAGNYGYVVTTTGAFALDTWKVNKKLTLNYGLRYDNYGNATPSLAGTVAAPFYLGSGTSFQQKIANGFLKQGPAALSHDINYNFSPRVGASWDVTGSGNWVAQGGFGIYYDQITVGNMADILKGNPPNWVVPTFYSDGSTAAPVFGFGTNNAYPYGFTYPAYVGKPLDAKGGQVGSQISIGAVATDVSAPRVYSWSGGIQRSLGRSMVASAAYVGSHGEKILLAGLNQGANQFGYDVNAFPGDLIQNTTCVATTTITPSGPVVTDKCNAFRTRLNTSFGTINYAYNASRSNYSAFIAALRGRFGQRAFFTASYTRSVSRDNASIYTPTASFDQNRFYGNTPFDVPNRFSFGGSYTTPAYGSNEFLKRLTQGFSLGGTITLQSGTPLIIYTGAAYAVQRINPLLPVSSTNLKYLPGSGDFSASGYNYDFPNIAAGASISRTRSAYRNGVFPGCQNFGCSTFTQPTFGQLGSEQVTDQFRNPAFAQTDASIKKAIKVYERFNIDLRLDAFNLFNQVNFYGLDGNLQDAQFGKVNSTHTARYLQIGGTINF